MLVSFGTVFMQQMTVISYQPSYSTPATLAVFLPLDHTMLVPALGLQFVTSPPQTTFLLALSMTGSFSSFRFHLWQSNTTYVLQSTYTYQFSNYSTYVKVYLLPPPSEQGPCLFSSWLLPEHPDQCSERKCFFIMCWRKAGKTWGP